MLQENEAQIDQHVEEINDKLMELPKRNDVLHIFQDCISKREDAGLIADIVNGMGPIKEHIQIRLRP